MDLTGNISHPTRVSCNSCISFLLLFPYFSSFIHEQIKIKQHRMDLSTGRNYLVPFIEHVHKSSAINMRKRYFDPRYFFDREQCYKIKVWRVYTRGVFTGSCRSKPVCKQRRHCVPGRTLRDRNQRSPPSVTRYGSNWSRVTWLKGRHVIRPSVCNDCLRITRSFSSVCILLRPRDGFIVDPSSLSSVIILVWRTFPRRRSDTLSKLRFCERMDVSNFVRASTRTCRVYKCKSFSAGSSFLLKVNLSRLASKRS